MNQALITGRGQSRNVQPFTDTTVLDLSQAVAGPICTQFLGALGARVVKVEPPEGDLTRGLFSGSVFPSVNLGGKESICVDLRSETGREVVAELADGADVIVENFRPGVLEQYGLDYESVSETNESVVYCSITGFGQEGPYKDYPAYDPIVQAMSGLMSTIGYQDRPPVRIGASVIDYGTGMNAAFLVASALQHRQQTGESVHIDTSLFDVAIEWMGYWITYYSKTGETPTREGGALSGSAPNDIYRVGDEELVYVSAPTDKQFHSLCAAIDREYLCDDERFDSRDARWEHREALRTLLEERFAEYSPQELSTLLVDHGVPAGPLRDIGEIVDGDPHVEAREMTEQLHSEGEDVKTAALPFRIDGARPAAGGEAPGLGQDSQKLLAALGYDDDEIDQFVDEGVIR